MISDLVVYTESGVVIVDAIITVQRAKSHCKGKTKHGTVLLVTVKSGEIKTGESIKILWGRILTDSIVCIQKDRVDIQIAQEGEKVGLLLATLRPRIITRLMRS